MHGHGDGMTFRPIRRGGGRHLDKAPREHDALLALIERHNLDHGGSVPIPAQIRAHLTAAGFTVPRRCSGRKAHELVVGLAEGMAA